MQMQPGAKTTTTITTTTTTKALKKLTASGLRGFSAPKYSFGVNL
jgi:hypothetical protein